MNVKRIAVTIAMITGGLMVTVPSQANAAQELPAMSAPAPGSHTTPELCCPVCWCAIFG